MEKVKPINGWTKKSVLETLEERMGSYGTKGSFQDEGQRCAVGALLSNSMLKYLMETGKSESVEALFGQVANIGKYLPFGRSFLIRLMHNNDGACFMSPKEATIKFIEANVQDDPPQKIILLLAPPNQMRR